MRPRLSSPLRCSWVPVAPSKSVSKPQHLVVHGKEYCIFDTLKGSHGIANDSCFHRGASLSKTGKVKDGCIECGYHSKKTRARTLRDRDGILWFDDGFDVAGELPTSWEFSPVADNRIFTYTDDFPGTNPLMMVENTLDWAHLATVHAFSFAEGEPRVIIDKEENTALYIYDTKIDNTTLIVENQFWAPWNTCLRFYLNDVHLFSLHFGWIPVNTNHTKLVVRVTRTHWKWTGVIGDLILKIVNSLPLEEDRVVVQSIKSTRSWNDDILLPGIDDFVSLYRHTVRTEFPVTYSLYFAE